MLLTEISVPWLVISDTPLIRVRNASKAALLGINLRETGRTRWGGGRKKKSAATWSSSAPVGGEKSCVSAGRWSAFSVLWFMIFQLEGKRIINEGKQEKLHVSNERTLELVWSFMCAYLCICSGPSVIRLSTRTASWRNTSTSQGEQNTQAASHLASHVKYYVTRSEPRLLTQTSVSEYNRLGSGVLFKPPFQCFNGWAARRRELFRFSPKPQRSWNFSFGSRGWWMFPGTNECNNQSASALSL